MNTRIVCVVPLYKPKQDEITNIDSYVEWLDYCILMDDSPVCKQSICEELIEKHEGKVEYIWNGQNVGLCRSANNGIKRAIELGAQWILIMNPDSKMHNNIVSIFRSYIDAYNTDKIAILAPQYNYDRHKRKGKKGSREIKFPNMSGSLININTISAIGDYDERCFIDGLDNEWCLRAIKAGYKIIECSEAILDHHPAETKSITLCGIKLFSYGWDTPERYYYQFRSLFLIRKLYHDFYNDLILKYKFLKSILLFDNKDAYINAYKMAKSDYKRGYFGSIANRCQRLEDE